MCYTDVFNQTAIWKQMVLLSHLPVRGLWERFDNNGRGKQIGILYGSCVNLFPDVPGTLSNCLSSHYCGCTPGTVTSCQGTTDCLRKKKHELYPANFGDQSAACTIIDQLFPTDTSSQKVPDGVEVNQQKQQVLNELCGHCSVFLHILHRYLRASF